MSILKNSKNNKKNPFRSPFSFYEKEDVATPSYEENKPSEKPVKPSVDSFEESRSFDIPKKRKKVFKRGRPKKAKGTKRDKRITFCCTETEARQIKLYSFERDLSVSEFIMRCVYQYIKNDTK